MATYEERLAILETNDKNIFHQLTEHKQAIENIQRLTIAIEKIAEKTNNISGKVDKIDERLNQVEKQPIRRVEKTRELIIASILSVLAGLIVGVFTTLILR